MWRRSAAATSSIRAKRRATLPRMTQRSTRSGSAARAMRVDPVLELPRFLEAALAAGHPWVYRDHVPRDFSAESGEIVRVRAGAFMAHAVWDSDSAIALRIYSTKSAPSASWVAERVRAAWELRESLRTQKTNAYRWIFGEGDGLPGITVDLYADYAVIATYAEGLDRIVGWLVDALRDTLELKGIVRRDERALEVIAGRTPPANLVVEEHGVRLLVDLRAGQKTGLFLDHRENRSFLAPHCAGRSVLNLFSYTGAFSIHAALAGATRVTSVDSAPGAIEAARENWRLNGLDAESHELVVEDVFAFLDRVR